MSKARLKKLKFCPWLTNYPHCDFGEVAGLTIFTNTKNTSTSENMSIAANNKINGGLLPSSFLIECCDLGYYEAMKIWYFLVLPPPSVTVVDFELRIVSKN